MSNVGANTNGGITRLALSQEDKEARDLLVSWMKEIDLEIRIDDVGNIYGRREGTDPEAKPIVLGSHLDSIKNSGKFDGTIGLLSALEVVRVFNENSINSKRAIEIVNFTNEEGIRFYPLMVGSGVLSGDFDIESVYEEKDKDNKRFIDELKAIGYLGEKNNRLKEAEAYIELHIEQGPVLFEEKIPIGVVEGIMGLTWLDVTITGRSDNSGPTPMYVRKDALCTAAKMVLTIQDSAKDIGERSITTVGKFNVSPDSVNTVPGEVRFSVDIRDIDTHRKNKGVQLVIDRLKKIAREDDMQINIDEEWSMDSIVFSEKITEDIAKAASYYGYPQKHVVSGAGHMTTYMNKVCPTAMIFVPSIEGKSHCPEEESDWEDINKGGNVLLDVVRNLAE
ncbi:hypothetical protein AZE41_18930 [Sporosarcina psychrophila]|nr:hypothetical protein AZE41_18930 [Sporosarcina psychrophila]